MLTDFEQRVLAYLTARPSASHGEIARTFVIRTQSAARFGKKLRAAGLAPYTETLKSFDDVTQH